MFWIDATSAFLGAFIGVATPFLIPKLFDFLLQRNFERFKLKMSQTQKAEKISDLFAYFPLLLSGWKPEVKDILHLNKLILELSLYLPRELVDELSQTLCLDAKRSLYKDCFIKVRKHLLNTDDGLIGENISHITLQDTSLHGEPK